jgi:hypothetical protein
MNLGPRPRHAFQGPVARGPADPGSSIQQQLQRDIGEHQRIGQILRSERARPRPVQREDPTWMTPACRGNENIARAPAATAAGTNPGHRAATRSSSGISIGDPSLKSSAPGPSPMVNWNSSSRALTSSEALTGSRATGPLTAVTLAPSTPSLSTAARHSAVIDTGASPSWAEAIHAQTLTARSPIPSASSPGAGPVAGRSPGCGRSCRCRAGYGRHRRWRAAVVEPRQGQPAGGLNATQSGAFMLSRFLRPGRRRSGPTPRIEYHQRPPDARHRERHQSGDNDGQAGEDHGLLPSVARRRLSAVSVCSPGRLPLKSTSVGRN